MSREDPQLKIRLPAELKARVEDASRAAGRSINSEVVQRLERSFSAPLMEPKEAARLWLFLGRLEDALRTFRQDLIAEEQAGRSPHGSAAAHRLGVLAAEYVRLTRPVLPQFQPAEGDDTLSQEGEPLPPPPPMPATFPQMPLPQLVIPQSLRDLAAVVAEAVFRKLEEGSRPGETPAERLERLMQITQEDPAPDRPARPAPPAASEPRAPGSKKPARRRSRRS